MIRILVAEDNAVNRELLRELLEARGYTVLEACNGQEALQMLEQTQPELLLLDIGMPLLDGFGVIRKIREDPRLELLPVVAVTAYAMRGDRERILASGFDGYLSKPLNPSFLTAELDRLLTKEGNARVNPHQGQGDECGRKDRSMGTSGSGGPKR
jgi:two-component system, cell cycle response regulator DivK